MPLGDDSTLASDTAPSHRALLDDAATPPRIGRYVVLEELGHGAMGSVLSAWDPQLDRRVAVKLLRGDESEVAQRRLLREAQAMARLHHPNVIAVHDAGIHGGRVYAAMEHFDGVTLREWMTRTHAWRATVEVFLRAADGLAAAHAAGLVHRDFKPANVMVDARDDVRVLDFGLASIEVSLDATAEDGDETLTRTGAVLGTPAYMAPEQWLAADVGPPADQFAFCVSLFEALYGHRPFEGDDLPARREAVLAGRMRAPEGRLAPRRIHDAVMRGLRTKPGDRFTSMDALASELRRGLVGSRRAWMAGIAGVVVTSAVGIAYARDEPCPSARPQLAGVWDEAVAADMADAFARVDLPVAADASRGVQTRLQTYADAWVDAYAEACTATRVHERQPPEVMVRRMACLDRGLRSLNAVVDTLREVDARLVLRSDAIAGTLEMPSRCLDVDALSLRPEQRGPAELEREILEQIDAATLASAAGRFDEAIEIATATRRRAEAEGYAWPTARAQLAHSKLLDGAGRPEDATTAGEVALDSALATDDARLLADAMLSLAMIGYTRDASAALRWVERARAVESKLAADPVATVRLHGVAGMVLRAVGRFEDALAEAERAVEQQRELATEDEAFAISLMTLGHAYFDLDRADDALAAYREATDVRRRVFGAHHPRYAESLQAIGTALYLQGDHARAKEPLAEAVPILEQTLGADDLGLAHTLNNLGLVEQELGDLDQAEALLKRALAIRRERLGAAHPDVASSLHNLGKIARLRGDDMRALQLQREALAIHEAALGPEHPRLVSALESIAAILLAQGRAAEALPELERAVAIETKAKGRPRPALAEKLAACRAAIASAD